MDPMDLDAPSADESLDSGVSAGQRIADSLDLPR
jgi:hypothetical protein